MGIKNNVFASRSERGNYYKLSRMWGDKYSIYHNLPFLNVFDTGNLMDWSDWLSPHQISITQTEIARLKKTSIDYTLCDMDDHPILCIEFDGLQQGFNVGTVYHPKEVIPSINIWRREITELKLKVALGSLFPFFVVGSKQFDDIDPDTKLTIVDAIIGDVLTSKATQSRIGAGFNPDDVGYSQDEFDAMSDSEQSEIIQNWVFGIEIETEMEHNPVVRRRVELQGSLGIRGWSEEFLTYPKVESATPSLERWKLIDNAILYGSKVILHTDDIGDVDATAWLPNFKAVGYSGITLSTEVAGLIAASKLKRIREGSKPR